MASFYTTPRVVGANGELQYNNNGVLGSTAGFTYDPITSSMALAINGVPADLTTLLKSLLEAEKIRLNGSYSIGTPGQVPFGVGPIGSIGTAFAPLGAEHYNVVHIDSGSFC
jgi:hypothetical protein